MQNSPFGSPFGVRADCEGMKVNETRTVAALAHASSAAGEDISCEYGSNKYYALCGLGGILSCGLTHTAVVPLDLVKCRIQVDPKKYGGIISGFRVSVAESGIRELGKGWAPTFFWVFGTGAVQVWVI